MTNLCDQPKPGRKLPLASRLRRPAAKSQSMLNGGAARERELAWCRPTAQMHNSFLVCSLREHPPCPWDSTPRAVFPDHPAAVCLDIRTGAVHSSLGRKTVKAAQACCQRLSRRTELGRDCEASQALVSPCGRKVLVMQLNHDDAWARAAPDLRSVSSGVLRIFDIEQDKLVAESPFTAPVWSRQPASWHPSSNGIVLAGFVTVSAESGAALQGAGITYGVLPEHCLVNNSPTVGFSSDGLHFLALSINKAQYLPHMRHVDADYAICPESRFCLLSCSRQNMQITFTPAHFLDIVPELRFHNIQLVPNSLMAFTNISMRKTDPRQSPSCLTNLAGPTEVHAIRGTSGEPLPMSLPLCFSPSGQLVCDSHGGPRIICLQTGKCVWKLDTHGDPCLTRNMCMSWLPSGRGVVFLASSRDCINAVHVLMFS